jgi:hypothetical protein
MTIPLFDSPALDIGDPQRFRDRRVAFIRVVGAVMAARTGVPAGARSHRRRPRTARCCFVDAMAASHDGRVRD